jgi:hypothetical protein
MTDFNKAQEEVFLQNKVQHLNQTANDADTSSLTNSADDENKSLSSTFSNSNSIDENGVALELAIQKFEHDLNKKADSSHKSSSASPTNMITSTTSSNSSIGGFLI